jgi:hypothetical protein
MTPATDGRTGVMVVGRVRVTSVATTVVFSVHAGCCRRQLND